MKLNIRQGSPKTWVLFVGLLPIVVAFDLGVSQSIPWLGIGFSTVLLYAILAFLALPLSQAVGWSFLAGFVMDMFSPAAFGSYMITCLGVIFIMELLHSTWFKQQSLLALVVIMSMSISLALLVLLSIQALAVQIGVFLFNPLLQVTWYGFVFGLIAQCVIIGILVKALPIFRKFVLL